MLNVACNSHWVVMREKIIHHFNCHTRITRIHNSHAHIKSLYTYIHICRQKNISENEKWHEVLSRAAIVVILTFMKLVFPLHPPSRFFFSGTGVGTSRNNKSKYLSVSVLFILLFKRVRYVYASWSYCSLPCTVRFGFFLFGHVCERLSKSSNMSWKPSFRWWIW